MIYLFFNKWNFYFPTVKPVNMTKLSYWGVYIIQGCWTFDTLSVSVIYKWNLPSCLPFGVTTRNALVEGGCGKIPGDVRPPLTVTLKSSGVGNVTSMPNTSFQKLETTLEKHLSEHSRCGRMCATTNNCMKRTGAPPLLPSVRTPLLITFCPLFSPLFRLYP